MKTETEQQQNPEPVDEIHTRSNSKKQLLITALIGLFLIAGTIGVIMYAKGYRFLLQKGEPQVTKTGILNVSSDPTGAQISIDGHVVAVSNNNVSLTPGKYKVTVSKDGYSDWQKDFE